MRVRLDKDSPIPLHWQLREQLRRAIVKGELRSGERLPTEEELCRALGISRSPVRQALLELEREGWISRVQGRGTFVQRDGRYTKLRVLLGGVRWKMPLEGSAARLGLKLEVAQDPLARLRERLIGLVARGQAPDLAVVDSVWVPELAQLEFLTPLEEIDRPWLDQDLGKDFYPSLLMSNTYEEKLYGVPVEADLSLLWYRRDWLEAEGLAPPRSWEELRRVAAHFREVGCRYGLRSFPLALPAGQPAGETTSYLFFSLLWSSGGEIVIEPGRVRLRGAERVLEFLSRLMREALLDPRSPSFGWRKASRLLAQGQAALIMGGSYEKEFIQRLTGWEEREFRGRVGFTAIPSPDGKSFVPVCGGMSYVVPRQAQNPRQVLNLVREASSPPVMAQFCRKTGQNAPRLSVSRELASKGDRFLAETHALLASARSRPALPIYPHISQPLQRMIEQVLAGELSPREAVGRVEDVLYALIHPTRTE